MNKTKNVGVISVNKEFAIQNNLNIKKEYDVLFGIKKASVKIKIDATHKLSPCKHTMEKLKVPKNFKFDVVYKKEKFYIGPFLGIIFAKDEKSITPKKLDVLKDYCIRQKKNNGCIFFMTLDKINLKSNQATGYIYDSKVGWEKKILPIPDMLFRRTIIGKRWGTALLKKGIKIFNYPVLNKWKVYKHLIHSSKLHMNLPYTTLYADQKDIQKMASSFKTIFLKPINKLGGRGIYSITKEDKAYHLKNSMDSKEEMKFDDFELLYAFLSSKIRKNYYIVQEGVNIVSDKNSPIDFRVFCQRNVNGKWEVTRVIGKIGKKNNIVSNIAKGGKMNKPLNVLIEEYKLNPKEAENTLKRLEEVSLLACEQFDNLKGNYALLGADVGLDKNLNVFVLEINHLQNGLYVKNKTFKPYYIAMIKGNVGDYGRYLFEN